MSKKTSLCISLLVTMGIGLSAVVYQANAQTETPAHAPAAGVEQQAAPVSAPAAVPETAPVPAGVAAPAAVEPAPAPAAEQAAAVPAERTAREIAREAQEKHDSLRKEKPPEFKPVPNFEMTKAEFETKTRPFSDAPNGDQYIAYKIRVPKEWEQAKAKTADEMPAKGDLSMPGINAATALLGEVVRFYGTSLLDARTFFTIGVSDLKQNITAYHWFMNYAKENSYTLQYLTEVSDKRVDAVYVLVEKDTSYVVRAQAVFNGNKVLLLTYAVPEPKWNNEKALQQSVLQSFSFQTPQDVDVEETRTYAFLDLLRFDYPVSWRLLAPNINSIEEMSAKVVNSDDQKNIKGEIEIAVVSTELDTTLPDIIKGMQKDIEERGLLIGKLVDEPGKYKFKDQVYFSRVEVYGLSNKTNTMVDYEFWVAVFIEDRYYYVVTMLTPSRTTGFYTWATNTLAFKTVIESIRP